ncbi:hypothetical protein C9374_011682 [Naegleria lovaniensis]|uniref:E3 ubiquitin-protein ligase TRIP12 n=1 Tax=Naegleria lovaniensis TaxID=51637 RepID=A0AA88GDW9_NAELO|nr:uncharacterized protein C9374_011682 [Naegleria lovaniensis]KAG2373797.1 hypothetical protein C9374_011682 [Naegleria lovaniensis]
MDDEGDFGYGSMSMSSSDFQNLASDQERINSLNELCTFLCIGLEDFIAGFDVYGWSSVLTPILQDRLSEVKRIEQEVNSGNLEDVSSLQGKWNDSREIITLILRALGSILDLVPRSCPTVLSYNPIPVMLDLLQIFSDHQRSKGESSSTDSTLLEASDQNIDARPLSKELFGDLVNEGMLEEILKCFDKISIEEPTALLNAKTNTDDVNDQSSDTNTSTTTAKSKKKLTSMKNVGFLSVLLGCLDSPQMGIRIKLSALKTICNLFRKMRVKEDFPIFIEQAGSLDALIRQIRNVSGHATLSNASGDINSTRQSLEMFEIICHCFAYILERSRFQKGKLSDTSEKKQTKRKASKSVSATSSSSDSSESIMEQVAKRVANRSMLSNMVEKLNDASNIVSVSSCKISQYILNTLSLYCDASPEVTNNLLNPSVSATTTTAKTFMAILKKWIDPQQQELMFSTSEKSSHDFSLLQDCILHLLNSLFPEVEDHESCGTIPIYIYGNNKYYWEDDYHNMNEYDENANMELEKHYRSGNVETPFNLMVIGRSYRIDLMEMKQQGGVTRNIKRNPLPFSFSRDVCIEIKEDPTKHHAQSPTTPPSSNEESTESSKGFFKRFFKKQKTSGSASSPQQESQSPSTPQFRRRISSMIGSSTKPTITKTKEKYSKAGAFSKLPSSDQIKISAFALQELLEPLIALSTNEFYRKDCVSLICKLIYTCLKSSNETNIQDNTILWRSVAKFAIKTLNQCLSVESSSSLSSIESLLDSQHQDESITAPAYLNVSVHDFNTMSKFDVVVISNCLKMMQLVLSHLPSDHASLKSIFVREGMLSTFNNISSMSKDGMNELEQSAFKVIHDSSQYILNTFFKDQIHTTNHHTEEEIQLENLCQQLHTLDAKILQDMLPLFSSGSNISAFQFQKCGFTTTFVKSLLQTPIHQQDTVIAEFGKLLSQNASTYSNLIDLSHSLLEKLAEKFFKFTDNPFSESTIKKFGNTIYLNISCLDAKQKGAWKNSDIQAEPLVTIRSLESFIKKQAQTNSDIEIYLDGKPCTDPSLTYFESKLRTMKDHTLITVNESLTSEFFNLSSHDVKYKIIDPKEKLEKFLEHKRSAKHTLPENFFTQTSYNMHQLLRWIEQFSLEMSNALDKSEAASHLINCLIFLKILYTLNENQTVNTVSFQNMQLSSKFIMQQQSSQFFGILVAITTHSIPSWMYVLTRYCGFLLPFSTRRNFFTKWSGATLYASQLLQTHCNATGVSSETRIGRKKMERVKIVDRENIISQTLTEIQPLHYPSKYTLEFEYESEAGIGLGPTLAYYDLVSKQLQKKANNLWMDESEEGEFVRCSFGIFPQLRQDRSALSESKRKLYVLVGSLIAKGLEDGRLLDMECNLPMLELLTNPVKDQLSLFDYAQIQPLIYNSLQHVITFRNKKQTCNAEENNDEWKKLSNDIEQLCLQFQFGNYNLVENGMDEDVTIHNIEKYCDDLSRYLCKEGIEEQLWCIEYGLGEVLSFRHGISSLQCFTPEELCTLIRGCDELWNNRETLVQCIQCSHGYNLESDTIKFLIDWLLQLNASDQRLFLQFSTGSSRVPVGGLKSLHPKLTVVKKTVENPDNELPTCNTCFHYLKLPAYSSFEVLKAKMSVAIQMGGGSFDLS